jgi:hypothetical protein
MAVQIIKLIACIFFIDSINLYPNRRPAFFQAVTIKAQGNHNESR